MIRFTKGNLLTAEAEALVNTVNTVGVMGKGIALMFKEAFEDNFKAYVMACKRHQVQVGKMFVTERKQLVGPRWIINFPTKKDWKHPSKMEWIEEGLIDLRRVIEENRIRSIAIPPLGSGNGKLDWSEVKPRIEAALRSLTDVDIMVFEPTEKYQNVAKRKGVEKLTPAGGLVAEMIRRYGLLGLECTILEVHKLAYFLRSVIDEAGLDDPLHLQFQAGKYGPYAAKLNHLLDALDGSYLHCEKRLADAGPYDVIWFEPSKKDLMTAYFTSPDAKAYRPALEATDRLVDGFQSPLGMELLATLDWLLENEGVEPSLKGVRIGLDSWPGEKAISERKQKLFSDRLIGLALERLEKPRLPASI